MGNPSPLSQPFGLLASEALTAITRKLAAPLPNGQQNQIESKPAIEVESAANHSRKAIPMSQNEEVFSAEERRAIAVKAVNRLIADAEAKRLPENKELAETIAVCIGESGSRQLQTLKWLLDQRE